MKKRETKRQIDLTSGIPKVSSCQISFLIDAISEYSVDYNTLMEEYESRDLRTEYLFMLPENHDPAIYQLIPLFCKHFGIQLYQINEKISTKDSAPLFIRIRKGDAVIDQVKQAIQSS
ncbi:hypothetical protein NEAUS06_1515 [Nematocida ausubeli]|nr:hypothetical protein NEAUS06_1515 [Nematocida ausubeli]